ncbi:MAG: FAD-dependent monooxygenase [Pseudomonadota bacterium]
MTRSYDVIVAGGGPAGATAAHDLAKAGRSVLLIDPDGRIKPCGGAIPTRCIRDFDLPPKLIKARIHSARMVSPTGKTVGMDIGDIGYVGMVDREEFDPWLRARAVEAGAERIIGRFKSVEQQADGSLLVCVTGSDETTHRVQSTVLIGADGANSAVRRAAFGPDKKPPYVFAYHEIVESPASPSQPVDMPGAEPGAGMPYETSDFRPDRCDVIYDGSISPDFYGWVFPHGAQTSIGCGTAVKGHSLKDATQMLRRRAGLDGARTIRREGAPLPLKPMRKWHSGTGVVLVGDAAGVVAPSSGEGIYYAMLCGRMGAGAALEALHGQSLAPLAKVRRRFMKEHGKVFFVLGLLQHFWYRSDKRREQFVAMCADADVQRLTWEAYLNKRLVRREPMAHMRVLVKDIQQLLGLTARP